MAGTATPVKPLFFFMFRDARGGERYTERFNYVLKWCIFSDEMRVMFYVGNASLVRKFNQSRSMMAWFSSFFKDRPEVYLLARVPYAQRPLFLQEKREKPGS